MKVRLEHMSFYLLIGTLLLAIGIADAFTCPEHCSCIEVQRKRYNYNHAKCTSLDGLRQLGKTSDLHSLDLSSLNLTKITNQLDKLTNLSKLDLSDNRLSEISALGQKRIRILNMSGNRITSGKLAKIPSTVKHLNLSDNDITILPESFKHFENLKSLELAGNPLNCTCETLDIRNWLQERKVWTEKPICCMAPLPFKGRSWFQMRQSDVCDPNDSETKAPRMLPFSDGTDDENDLMLGDDPNAGQSDESDEGIESDFLPVTVNEPQTKRSDSDGNADETAFQSDEDDFDEGSGSEPEESVTKGISVSLASSTIGSSSFDLYEGSGDVNDATELPSPASIPFDEHSSNETVTNEDENASDDLITANAPSSLNSTENASIETSNEIDNDSDSDHDTVAPVTEEAIVPVKSVANDAEYIHSHEDSENQTKQSESTKLKEVHESNSTYILLAILGILLVALILYVATKRTKTNTKNRRNNNDIESPAQELLTMDKNNLGKPIPNPVEFIPLIPEKHDTDKKVNRCNGDEPRITEEPLLQKLTEVENENESAATKSLDDKQSPAQQLNGNAKPIQNGVHPDKVDDGADKDQRQFQPISPKPSRYSPVSDHSNIV